MASQHRPSRPGVPRERGVNTEITEGEERDKANLATDARRWAQIGPEGLKMRVHRGGGFCRPSVPRPYLPKDLMRTAWRTGDVPEAYRCLCLRRTPVRKGKF
jgi:hypothetical protein